MTKEQESQLKQKISEMTRISLDNESIQIPFPVLLRQHMQSMGFIRLIRLAKFWKHEQTREEESLLDQSCIDLITGLYGQHASFAFILRGYSDRIECWLGITQTGSMDMTGFRSALSGAFPDVRFNALAAFDKSVFDQFQYALILTGIPSRKTDPQITSQRSNEHIEKVCRGLYGTNWLYAIYASPDKPITILGQLETRTQEIQQHHRDYLLNTNPTGGQNRLARRYVDLLEAELSRLEQGRRVGMWNVQSALMVENSSLAGLGQALLRSAFSGEQSTPEPFRVLQSTVRSDWILQSTLTSRELAILARLPREEYPGYEIVDYARFGVEPGNVVVNGTKTIRIGDIYDRGAQTGTQLALTLSDVTKHGLIVGVTGSGKTNTCFWLLRQLWHEHHIPFLVIESAKSEYRSLLNMRESQRDAFLFNDLRVFTIGAETVSPLRLNPFEVLPGIAIQTHIDYLKSLFSAAFVLYPPMPYVLEQSLQEVYTDRGWNLALNTNSRIPAQANGSPAKEQSNPRMFPTLSDLIAKVEVVIQRMQYDNEITMNVRAGLVARLNQLRIGGGKGLMFNSRQSIPTEILFNSPCLLELKQLVSDDEKAFLIGLLLIRLYEYYEGNPQYRPQLRHVTLIEEAHRLLRNVSTEQGSEVSANPKGRAIEVFANILSEIRAYGEGILIAEQIPTKLTPDAIKNTNLKIVHRLVAEDDRKVVGSTMNLTDTQTRYLTTLEKGEGIAYTEGMRKPVFLKVPPAKSDEAVTDDVVRSRMSRFRTEHENIFRRFAGCAYCPRGVKPWECPYKGNEEHDSALKESFLRLFNALRLNKPAVFEAYHDFIGQYQRLTTRGNDPREVYCVFAELIEPELERRGEFGKWPYPAVDDAIQLVCDILAIIVNNVGMLQRKEFEKLYWDKLITFSNQLKGLHKINVLPYHGCQVCPENQRCLYRFDMVFLDNDRGICDDFQTYIMDDAIQQASNVCCYAGHKRFLRNDILSSCGAALCFAVQQLHFLGATKSEQQAKSEKLKELVQLTLKEAHHGKK